MDLAFVVAETPRVPWRQSNLRGSPEPPPPFVLERAFPHEFSGPISLNRYPGTSTFLVLEQNGRIVYFDSDTPQTAPQLLVDFNASLPPHSQIEGLEPRGVQLFSIAFHPDFELNRQAYVCYITSGPGAPTDTHVARFTMPRNATADVQPPSLLVDSEQSVLVCEGGGHNGCTLAFGTDGFLYISIGDLEVPTPPDPRDTGQDISDLYASILRIDVDGTSHDPDGRVRNYAIPADNPFVDLPDARPEVYAYGLRNPFRMAFDPPTGDLWVGDVGWEAWEMVYRVRSGGNYGWAIKEGPGDVKPQTLGPTPILPADVALGHAEAASVTGGMVYRGERLPELAGKYIFGDWITRKFWASSFDTERVIETQEIAVTNVKPICFEIDQHGELLVLEYSDANEAAAIYRFARNPAEHRPDDFPRMLSQTGLFATSQGKISGPRRPAPGVVSYTINAPMWADGAQSENLVAVPDQEQIVFYQQPQKTFNWFRTQVTLPIGSVLAKTYVLGDAGTERPVETQVSVKDAQGEWQYYSYQWNQAGDDAGLVPAAGASATWQLDGAGQGSGARVWQYAARSSCRICHTPWTGETVGFVESQLRSGQAQDNWHTLQDLNVIVTDGKELGDEQYSAMVNPHDERLPIDRRARSYLHTNCAHCHMNGGNASTVFGLNFDLALEATQMVDVPPMRGDLGLAGANIVTAGRPQESVLLYRMSKAGSGRMPHVGSVQTDVRGTRLIHQWIAELSEDAERRKWLDTVIAPHMRAGGAQARIQAAERLMESLPGALELSAVLAQSAVPAGLQSQVIEAAMQRPHVSELFEAYATAEQLPKRLGERFDAQQVLGLAGDTERGKQSFAAGLGSCVQCHRVGSLGTELGPNLAESIAKYKTRDVVLQHIVQPSLAIDANFQSTSLLTTSGSVLVVRVLEQTDSSITFADATGKRQSIPADEVEAMRVSPISLMPEQLLSPLTAQQARDLLEYLMSLAP